MKSQNSFFVYGTLKQDQVRESCWPRKPRQVCRATTNGFLFDLGPYPAMTAGTDVVEGEIWTIDSDDLEVTLRVLDEIEVYQQFGEDDLYTRVVQSCCREDGATVDAWVYLFTRPADLPAGSRLKPNEHGICGWNG